MKHRMERVWGLAIALRQEPVRARKSRDLTPGRG
jgi:hypothetical protein